jgi:murein hydrolase activator
MTKFFVIPLILFISLNSLSAYASTKEGLAQTEAAIEQSKAKQAKIEEDTQSVVEELSQFQERLVVLAGSIQKNEAALSDLEEKRRILNEQLNEKNIELKKREKNLELLVYAALSLSRTPPEAMMMMPTSAMESMKTASALKMASDEIRRETQSIAQQLVEIKALQAQVSKNYDAILVKKTALDLERANLKASITERNALRKQLGGERKKESQRLEELAKKAKDIKALMDSVEENDSDRKAVAKKPRDGTSRELRSFAKAKGAIKPPTAGKITQVFGSAQAGGATSRGIAIRSRAGGRVVSPYDGEVIFTGPFLAYGQMVILRHSDDFHTLLAGLAKIDVESGQFLLEGEPIGAMGEDDDSRRLYIELRKDNRPIDPSAWISGLRKKKN